MDKGAKLYAVDVAEKINDLIRSMRQGLPTITAQTVVDKAKNDDEILFFYERMCIKDV